MSTELPYGSWPSPVTAADVAAATPRFDGAAFVGNDVWWGESVPSEGGRTTIRRHTADGGIEDLLPAPWDARSRVHEYGGGSWAASPEGRLFFVDKRDQRVWTLTPGSTPAALTPDEGDVRFGGLRWSAGRLLAIRESHLTPGTPPRAVVAISDTGVDVLAAGSDFVAQPALSPDGETLAWVAWDHPSMPWDTTEIRVSRITPEALTPQGVTSWSTRGTPGFAALQPEWAIDGRTLYLDDPSGRWTIWQDDHGTIRKFAAADADTGGPLWVLGSRWYAPLDDGRVVAIRTNGSDELVVLSPDGVARTLPLPARSRVNIEDAAGTRVLVTGSAPGVTGVWLVDVDGEVRLIRGAGQGDAWLPVARTLTVEGPHGPIHAVDYPPTHPTVRAPAGEVPPYLVWVHGGPTAHVADVPDGKVTYFTSRGIGVLDVNYGGSTGYGRAYRERLNGQWGIVDVDDVAAAAAGLAAAGLADPQRLAIEGGSAGGWTVLSALVNTDVFAAGVSRYGVGDARALAADTHDFEARYLDGLIGPLPQAEEVYIDRSPLTHAERFRVPLLLLQGEDDAVVPPAQSDAIRDALEEHGIPHLYVLYPGEGHGFRRAETVIHALETELAFLGRVFGFDTPGVAPVRFAGEGEPGDGQAVT